MPQSYSLLDLVDICDNVHIGRALPLAKFDNEHLITWRLNSIPESPIIGLLRPTIIDQLIAENVRSQKLGLPEVWNLQSIAHTHPVVTFHSWLDTYSKRTDVMREVCERWRDTGLFQDVCGPEKWRGEMYPVYKDPFGPHDYPSSNPELDAREQDSNLNYAFEMERAACALFGVVTYGVHMSVYDEITSENGEQSVRVWVPTRAKTKQTWPGYLDNTVAGGIPSGMSIFESLVKEAMEEASFSEEIVRKYARAVDSVSYFLRTSTGWLQPEIEYVYDLRIPTGIDPALFAPKPSDDEVECFEFISQDQVMSRLRQGLFKPNCALVLINLFIRLGYITPDNEPDFMKINTRLHGRFDYEKW